ncbi:hydroxypyruvate reductase [Ruminiclostridium hungatei]|uniref:D-3-phosphoglycerate dehydrogenase n=1 Tax=Ruminiclostridium hungatei TaxID=48256 RepID=A0A1V4SFV4_RUMHU|nr:phosphoglycerate dehydrogenase [Ruminiclostridium hungatei]OPX42730.1 hydroxypyruvate reductase [Ruminiclostridium hungatei]
MYKIQMLNKIANCGLELLPKENYDISTEEANPDGILVRSANMLETELPKNLKAIARAGAGVNNIPIEKCTEKGIVVFNTPGANSTGVKELVIAALLLSSRKITKGMEWVQTLKGKGDEIPKLVEKGKSQFEGPEIKSKKIGVIGLGAIGVMVANDCISLGMEVMGYDPYISVKAAWGLSSSVIRANSLEHLLSTCDYITIHVPLTKETKNTLDKEKFEIMKKGVRIINLARGGLVSNQDLLEAIGNGTVACYVTDFPEEELLGVEEIIAIPHLGASTPESEENCAIMAANQLKDYLETGMIKNSVNFPDCDMLPTDKTRIITVHRNIPNMIGQMTTILAANKINIADMLTRHKDTIGYNVIDIEGDLNEEVIDRIRAIDGVKTVRVISGK